MCIAYKDSVVIVLVVIPMQPPWRLRSGLETLPPKPEEEDVFEPWFDGRSRRYPSLNQIRLHGLLIRQGVFVSVVTVHLELSTKGTAFVVVPEKEDD